MGMWQRHIRLVDGSCIPLPINHDGRHKNPDGAPCCRGAHIAHSPGDLDGDDLSHLKHGRLSSGRGHYCDCETNRGVDHRHGGQKSDAGCAGRGENCDTAVAGEYRRRSSHPEKGGSSE